MDWIERIREYLKIPENFSSGVFPEAWSGPHRHTGPSGDTPLKMALTKKTQGGLYALLSGVLVFCAARLASRTDVSPIKDLAIALFLLQQSNFYYKPAASRVTLPRIDRLDRFGATEHYILHLFYQDRFYDDREWPLCPNFATVAMIIMLTRHHMGEPERILFDAWVEGMIDRVALLAPLPDHKALEMDVPRERREAQRLKTMGAPVPPQTLALETPLDEINLPLAWHEFLTTVDWRENRFLKEPGEVLLPDGWGVPYREPR